MRVLFVNCCIRGQESRTLRLCQAAIEQMKETLEDGTVEELVLDQEDILPLNSQRLAQRHEMEEKGQFDHPMLRFGRQFNEADLI